MRRIAEALVAAALLISAARAGSITNPGGCIIEDGICNPTAGGAPGSNLLMNAAGTALVMNSAGTAMVQK